MSTAPRRIRALVGGVIAVAAVAGVALAVPASWPRVDRNVLSVTADPEASTSRLACGGATLVLGRDPENVSSLAAAATQRVTVGVSPAAAEAAPGEMAVPDVPGGPPATSFAAEPTGGARTDLAAAGSSTADDEDLAGFAAAACTPPTMESWLVAGSGLTGAADLVVIANPGDVASRVDLTVFGAEGSVAPEAGADILVPAGSQRVVPLASLALGEANPVVRVTAAQAPVQATLQSSLTRTLVPGGIDQSDATSRPATQQVIPGIAAAGGPGADTIVRVLAPSDDTTASVTVTEVGASAPTFAARDLELVAGTPLEVDVESLAAGRYRVDVEAEAPVVASLWTATGVGAGSDFGWFAAADPLSVPSLFAVAAGPSPRLAIAAGADDATVTVTSDAGEGDAREVEVPAGGAVSIAVEPGSVYRIDAGEETIRANVVYAGDGAVAGYPVVPADAAASPVVVRPR
ncbi:MULTISPECIES: DUF5719 family protein [unclassified Microbacterium]|uniref:DUF5719 family protein n=1 Tax=unclassified Microbacterium TaxID=2609290 RepID=UPI0038680377